MHNECSGTSSFGTCLSYISEHISYTLPPPPPSPFTPPPPQPKTHTQEDLKSLESWADKLGMRFKFQCFNVQHHEHCKISYLLLLLLPKQYHLTASHFQPIPWHPTHWQPQVVSTHHLYHKEGQQHVRISLSES